MKKEIFKNFCLTLLVCVSVFLFYKIWFSEKLWSSDYNFFTVIWGNSQEETVADSSIEDILRPRKIVFSGDGKRYVSTKGDKNFEKCFSAARTVLGKIDEKSSKFSPATKEEMRSAIKSTSVIVDFGTTFGGEISEFLGTYFPCSRVRDAVISLSDTVVGKPLVYVTDMATGEIFKTVVDISSDEVYATISEYLKEAENIPFAFELGFSEEKQSEDSEITQNILLSASILIDLAEQPVSGIEALPLKEDSLTPSETDALLRRFDMKKASAKRYIETNNATVYVDGGNTLRISPDGTIEYTAMAEGPQIYDPNSKNALSSAVGNIYSYVRSAFRSFKQDVPALQISSDLVNLYNNTQEVTINIDYYVNSIPVMIWPDGHAISITMKNGKLVSYKHHICSVKTTGETLYGSNMLQAVDGLYLTLQGEETTFTVSDIFRAYTNTSGREKKVSWCAKLAGSDEIIIIDGEGGV